MACCRLCRMLPLSGVVNGRRAMSRFHNGAALLSLVAASVGARHRTLKLVHSTPRHLASAAGPNRSLSTGTWSQPKEGASCTERVQKSTTRCSCTPSNPPTSTHIRKPGQPGVDLVRTHVCSTGISVLFNLFRCSTYSTYYTVVHSQSPGSSTATVSATVCSTKLRDYRDPIVTKRCRAFAAHAISNELTVETWRTLAHSGLDYVCVQRRGET